MIGRSLIPEVCNDPFADVDGDRDVDMEDFAVFQRCFTGTAGTMTDVPTCGCLDFVRDGKIDDFDLAAFRTCGDTSRSGFLRQTRWCDNP